ncbi:tellurite resistance TerB family protein [Desulforegula conservatrix]|uniref:tellurite resistance TerB family protein n=1 Tax=Desulforegula conservatrix TaxID=153026 RepID=UPI000419E0DD|nr:TerB family tellurite resistance protein [Desulforegula conservatrix]
MDNNKEVALRLIECMLIISYSDGHLDESEIEVIINIASQTWNGSDDDLKMLIQQAIKNIENNNDSLSRKMDDNADFFSGILDSEGKTQLINIFEELINADGKITKEELNLFNKFHDRILCHQYDKKVNNHEGYKDSLIIFGASLLALPFGLANIISPQLSFLIVAVAAGYIIWDKFFRRRCSVCCSKRNILFDEQELDRWLGRKTVYEKTASGKTKSKNVQTTYMKIKRFYRCNDCAYEWAIISNEEK